jgi:tripartite-type tricarboxylate transporter receptor subunit TctC
MKSLLLAAGFLFLAVTAEHSALAQKYPSKPIRMVVPFAAGSATDIVAHAVADPLSKSRPAL